MREADTMGRTGELGAEIKHRLPPLKALTSLRFFAAIYVVVFHLSREQQFSRVPLLGQFLASGFTGVSLFFVLSGFILAYNYRDVLSPREFWVSRFARIYPVYLLALLLGFAYAFAPATQPPDHIGMRLAFCVTLLQTWWPPFSDSFNGPGWTLSVEAFFYALFPFLLGWMRRVSEKAFVGCCVAYLVLLAVPLGIHAAAPGGRAAFAVAHYMTWGTLPPMHLPIFLIGVYLGMRYLKSGPVTSRWPLALGAAGTLVLLCLGPGMGPGPGLGPGMGMGDLFTPLRKGLLTMTYAALIYGLASVRRGWLTSRWMVLAGEISFSIYILQTPVVRTVLAACRRSGLGFYASTPVALFVLVGISYLAFRFVELPARVAIRSRLTGKRVELVKI